MGARVGQGTPVSLNRNEVIRCEMRLSAAIGALPPGTLRDLSPVLSENHIRTSWWCSPARPDGIFGKDRRNGAFKPQQIQSRIRPLYERFRLISEKCLRSENLGSTHVVQLSQVENSGLRAPSSCCMYVASTCAILRTFGEFPCKIRHYRHDMQGFEIKSRTVPKGLRIIMFKW